MMAASVKEAAMKKKLQQFLVEMFKMGTVRGFQHFSMYLRGKEEMGLTVYHEPQLASRRCSIFQNTAPATEVSAGESLTSSRLPYDQQALVLSQGTQMALSGMEDRGVGLPPASPSENEDHLDTPSDTTLFLVAGYSRYSCPYVWVRSNHRRLMKMSGAGDGEKDNPLRLKSTTRWKDGEVHIWDIIGEVVKLCMYPAPRNPFAVDMDYFLSLSTHQQVLATAAMMVCLQKIVLHTSDDRRYAGKVLEDLQTVSRLHYTALQSLVKAHQLPIFEQYRRQQQQQKQQQQAKSKRGGFAQSRDRYPSIENPLEQPQRGSMSIESTQGIYTPQGSAQQGFPGYGFTPAPSLF